MNDAQRSFLDRATAEAVKANHPFAQMAACEAALESGHVDPVSKVMVYGGSELAREANNLFGMKQHSHPIYGTMNLPTREWQNGPDGHATDGRWIPVTASWVEYPDWAACFADRLATLQRLSNAYPHYAAALRAPDARTYVTEISKTWSTDPNRASKVLGIYEEYMEEKPS